MITLYNEKNEKLKLISVFEFNDADMGESSISATVSFSEEQDFHPDWHVVYNGEKFYLGVRKPTGKKDTSSLSTTYTLVFKSEREDLKRYTFMDFVELGSGNPQPSSYNVPLYATLSEFVDRFNLNLRHYMGDRWRMVLPQDYTEDGNAISISFDNATLWDVLIKVYEIYGVRWVIRSAGNVLQIQVGFQEIEIEHVFEYGKDNGLVSVERNNALERIITRLRGRGSERNLPPDYFHAGDPDTNSSLQAVFFKNLMPKVYRDYVRGYNAGSGSGTWAYNQGVSDKAAGRNIAPIDYALSDKEDLWGISYGAMEPNEKIFPTLQGATRHGVRLDEVLAVEKVLVDGVREPQNTIAIGIDAAGQESSSGKCGNSPKNNYLEDCRGGIEFTIFTDRFQVTNPINTAQIRITMSPSYIGDDGLPVPVEFGATSTVRSSAELQLVDFANSITGEVVRTQTISDTDSYLWELDDIPSGDYRFKANVVWSANIQRAEYDPTASDVVVNVDTRLTGATVKEYARATDKGEWKETFDIEIRDVWGIARNADESDKDYTYRVWEPRAVSEDMTVMFSDGLLAGEDYEFRIVGFNSDADDLRQTIITAIKPTAEGGWRLTLQKSDAELEAGNIYLPNTQQNAKPGDHFFFINISMPYDPYVYDAEARLNAYLEEQLAMKDEEFPSFTITPSKIFCSSFGEVDKIKAGAKIRVRNVALIGDSYISLYIQSLTKRYNANSLNPEWSLTLSDLVVASGNPVEVLEGQVNVLTQRVYSNRSAVQEAVRSLSNTFVRKDGIADVSYSPTEFKKNIKLGEGIADKGFRAGDIQGQGFGVYTDDDGNRVIEADVLVGRIGARFNDVVINQVSYNSGKQVFSAAGMVVSRVEDAGTSWRCYFDTKNSTVRNYFTVNDGAFSQRFTDAGIRQYWARVTAIGADYIEISKTDRMQGSFDPVVGDNIAQLGNSADKSRQAALMIDETHEGGGLVTWYDDITDFTLSNKDSVNIGRVAETIEVDGEPQTEYKTWLQVYGSAFIGNKDKSQFVEFDDKTLKLKGRLEVGSTISDAMTVVEDGLIQSTLLKLGYYKDDVFKIMSGTNGLYDENVLGGGIAAWYGGPMGDKEADSTLVEYAKSLFRFDGSGYLAGGNITWDKDGAGSVAGGDLSWDKDGVITLGSAIKISGDVDATLGSILEYVNELRKLWSYDKQNNAVRTPLNLIVEGGGAFGKGSGGGGDVPTTSDVVIKFEGDDDVYAPVNGVITLPAYPEGSGEGGGIDEAELEQYLKANQYAKKSDIPSLNGYATEQWVNQQGFLTQHQDLSAYAKSEDVANTYATKSALKGVSDSVSTLRTDFDNLNDVLNGNVGGVIDTWNEVVDFLDGYSQSDDLAAILSGMNTDIANRVLIEDFEKLEEAVNPLFGYFDANGNAKNALKLGGQLPSYYATADALNTHIKDFNTYKTTADNRLDDLEALWYMDDEGNVHTTHNIVVDGGGAFGKGAESGEDVGGLGKVTIYLEGSNIPYETNLNGEVTIPAYPTALKNPYALTINGHTYDGSEAVNITISAGGGVADSVDWANVANKPTTLSGYGITDALPLSGGTIDGNLIIGEVDNTSYRHLQLIRLGHGIRLNNTDIGAVLAFGAVDNTGYLTPEKYIEIGDNGLIYSPDNTNRYPLIHSGNIGLYAPIYNSNGNVLIGATEDNGYKLAVNGSLNATTIYQNGQTLDKYYLPLRGGTISGGLTISSGNLLVEKGDTITNKLYPIADNAYTLGQNSRRWSDVRTVLINGYTPVHSGNYSSYALPLSGGTISGSDRNLLVINTTNSLGPIFDFSVNDTKISSIGHLPLAASANYGLFINNNEANIGLLLGSDRKVYITEDTSNLTKTHLIVHSHNISSFNAGSATKLQDNTAFTVWGQTFFENGKPKMVRGEALIGAVLIGRDNNAIDGWWQGSEADLYLNYTSTKNIRACYNGGNVIIGNATDNGAKLQVGGSIINNATKDKYSVNYSVYYAGMHSYMSNLANGDNIDIAVGKAYAAKQMAYFGYHRGSSDDDSYLTLGLHSVDNALNIRTSGNILIGTTDDNGYKLQVAGSVKANGIILPTSIPNEIKSGDHALYISDVGIGAEVPNGANGLDVAELWAELTSVDATKKIDISHIPTINVDWNSISAKPNTLSGYGITDALSISGGILSGSLQIGNLSNTAFTNLLLIRSGHGLRINNTSSDGYIAFGVADASGYYAEKQLIIGDSGLVYTPDISNYYKILHSGNYSSYALPLSGGTINGNLIIGEVDNTLYRHLQLIRLGHGIRLNNTDIGAVLAFGAVDNTGYLTPEKYIEIGDNGLIYSPDNTNRYPLIHSGNIGLYAPIYNSNGNVLIGTTADNGAKLQIKGGISPYATRAYNLGTAEHMWLAVYTDIIDTAATRSLKLKTSGVERVRIDSDTGFVGINKTNPTRPLDIKRDGTSDGDVVSLVSSAGWCNIVYQSAISKIWSVGANQDSFYWWNSQKSGTVAYIDNAGNLIITGGGTFNGGLSGNGLMDWYGDIYGYSIYPQNNDSWNLGALNRRWWSIAGVKVNAQEFIGFVDYTNPTSYVTETSLSTIKYNYTPAVYNSLGEKTEEEYKYWTCDTDWRGQSSAYKVYQNGLKKNVNQIGWYRVYEIKTSGAYTGRAIRLTVATDCTSNSGSLKNETYTFDISNSYGGEFNVTQVSGCKGGGVIDKIRIDYSNSGYIYIDIHVARLNVKSYNENGTIKEYIPQMVYITGTGDGDFMRPKKTTDSVSGTYEFLVAKGVKTDGDIESAGLIIPTSAPSNPQAGKHYLYLA